MEAARTLSAERVRVGVGEARAVRGPARLSTYGIGSCVGVCLVAEAKQVAGLLHAQLPQAKGYEERARSQPALFVDAGLLLLFRELESLGVGPSDLRAFLIGGAQMSDGVGSEIGPRNIRVARRLLWRQNIAVERDVVGGATARTVHLSIAPFSLEVKSPGGVRFFIP